MVWTAVTSDNVAPAGGTHRQVVLRPFRGFAVAHPAGVTSRGPSLVVKPQREQISGAAQRFLLGDDHPN
jgi:hypothetical protein